MKTLLSPLLAWAERSFVPGDSEEERLKKQILVCSAVLAPGPLLGVGAAYIAGGAGPVAFLFFGFVAYVWLQLILFVYWYKSTVAFVHLIAAVALPTHLSVTIALGGFVQSGAIVMWGLAFPVGTGLVFLSWKQMIPYYVFFLFNLVVSTLLPLTPYYRVDPDVAKLIFMLNLVSLSAMLTVVMGIFVRARGRAYGLLATEQEKAERLLLNILPAEIAGILKDEERTIAHRHEMASVLFADVVGFTPLSASMEPEDLVEMLNEVFSCFDDLALEHGLEKIKTIGDCYMAAAGVPHSSADHAQRLVRTALAMQDVVRNQRFRGHSLGIRIGINSGPVVAGVIGRRKFIYDLWGDAVNTASRMESHGVAGRVQVTESTYALVRGDFECRSVGRVHVKGKGELEVFEVLKALQPDGASLRA